MTTTFTVRGHKIRTQTQRRYVVVAVGNEHARLLRRSDSVATARTVARRYGFPTGGGCAVVVDTTTGKEV